MKKETNFLIRAGIFIALSFLVIPDGIRYLAEKLVEGNLRLGEFPYINGVTFAIILVIIVLYKNFEKLKQIKQANWKETILFGAFTLVFLGIFFLLHYAGDMGRITRLIFAWSMYTAAIASLAAATLGPKLLISLWKDFVIAISALIGYIGITLIVEATTFHKLTMHAVVGMLKLFTAVNVIDGRDPTVKLNNFQAVIGEPCSGVFSIVLFTAIFSFVLWLDHKKIILKKAFVFYAFGVIGAYLLNLLRVMALLLIGEFYSADFAIKGFHTNAGWIIFAAYSLAYWFIVYPKLLKK